MLHSESQVSSHSGETLPVKRAEESQKQDEPHKIQYFMNIICDTKILADPRNNKLRFSNKLWKEKQIKSIRIAPNYVEISVNQKNKYRNSFENVKKTTPVINLQDDEYQKQLNKVQAVFNADFPTLKQVMADKTNEYWDTEFKRILKELQMGCFVVWLLPLRDEGPKLRKLAITKNALRLLGYEPQQFAFEIEKYVQVVADFWGGQAYRSLFIQYLSSFCRFMSHQIRNDISLQDCIKESQITLVNEMCGKNHKVVNVEMTMWMANITVCCYELHQVLEQSDSRVQELNKVRNNLTYRVNSHTYHSLSSITKLPKAINPANNNKICSYVVIREPSDQENGQEDNISGI